MFDGPSKKRDFETNRKDQNRKRALAEMHGNIRDNSKAPDLTSEEKMHRAVTMHSSPFRTIPDIIDLTRLQKWTGA